MPIYDDFDESNFNEFDGYEGAELRVYAESNGSDAEILPVHAEFAGSG